MTATEVPIARMVKRWFCPWCGRGFGRRAGALGHMTTCFDNHARRACKTCAHFRSGDFGSSYEPPIPASCAAPDRDISVKFEFTADCPLWAARKDTR